MRGHDSSCAVHDPVGQCDCWPNRLRRENDSLHARLKDVEQDASRLRELLWLYHGCPSPALYGDDGEMQCGACVIDFRRNTVETIRARWEAKARAALTAARGEPPDGR